MELRVILNLNCTREYLQKRMVWLSKKNGTEFLSQYFSRFERCQWSSYRETQRNMERARKERFRILESQQIEIEHYKFLEVIREKTLRRTLRKIVREILRNKKRKKHRKKETKIKRTKKTGKEITAHQGQRRKKGTEKESAKERSY